MSGRELEGRVALVTGGGRNIGRAIALDLADAGAAVAIVARSDAVAAAAVVAEIEAKGGQALSVLGNVADEADVARLFHTVLERFGRLDVLVNNAAVRNEVPFEDMTLAQWREVLAVTLDGAFLCSRAALDALTASDAGAIVCIGGLTAYTGARHRAHVVAAKAGLDGLTKALAQELGPRGITVNLVSPGLIETIRGSPSSPGQPQHHGHSATLVGRRGRPEEVAAMVRYLVGPHGRYITGQTVHVNGGAFLP